ncbi:SDR family oxidoreductase [Micromonospora psammae]|uniref:SDR family oxidoreductase n=1 Tax=Micromonospora sp. CPCC 205556 TaxID=3122398 RepID=UPI002FF34F92
MDVSESTALVTGANRGFGRAIAGELLSRGATVWAAARETAQIDLPGVRPLRLDITDPASVSAAAEIAGDVTMLVNNAGSSTGADLLTGDMDQIRLDMETHYFGTLAVTRAFAPVIESNGGGAVLNVMSVLSWFALPSGGAYAGAKAAEWGLTNALRVTLAPAGIRVVGLHVGFMDTDMAREVAAAKLAPAEVARYAVDQLATGAYEILADDLSRDVQRKLSGGVAALYPQLP